MEGRDVGVTADDELVGVDGNEGEVRDMVMSVDAERPDVRRGKILGILKEGDGGFGDGGFGDDGFATAGGLGDIGISVVSRGGRGCG